MQWCEYESSSCVCAYFRVQLATTNDYVEIEVEKKGIRSSTGDYISNQTQYDVWVRERNEYQIGPNTHAPPIVFLQTIRQRERAQRELTASRRAGISSERKIWTSINGGWREYLTTMDNTREGCVNVRRCMCSVFFHTISYATWEKQRERERKKRKRWDFSFSSSPILSLSLSVSTHRRSEEQVQSVICYASDILCGGVIDFLSMSKVFRHELKSLWYRRET